MEKRNPENDAELIEACLNKDMAAWAVLVKKYSALVFIAIKSRLKDCNIVLPCQDIEDIRQNVFASIWKGEKLRTVRSRKNIRYWLAIVSGNTAIEYIRSKRAYNPSEPVSLFVRISTKGLSELVPSTALNPHDESVTKEAAGLIESAIGSLPAKERLIIKLNLLYDKKYREIAGMLNLPPGTVSSCIKRTKERLRESLKDLK